jgi:hypothetical protein
MTDTSGVTADRKAEQVLRHQRVAAALKAGKPIRTAMLEGGYSEGQARLGRQAIPKGVINQLARDGERFRSLGRQFKPEDRADIVRGKLVENVLLGKDSATKSLELLGKDTAVGIFKSDSNVVAVQINLPSGLEALFGELKQSDPVAE